MSSSSFTHGNGGYVSYGDNNIWEFIGTGAIVKFPNPMIGEVLLVDGLNFKE